MAGKYIINACLLLLLCITAGVKAQYNQQVQQSSYNYRGTPSVKMYLDSAKMISKSNPMYAISLVNKAIELCISNDDKDNEAAALLVLGDIQHDLGQNDLAIENYRKCIKVYASGKSVKSLSKQYNTAGNPTLFYAYKNMAQAELESNRLSEAYSHIVIGTRDYADNVSTTDLNDGKRVLASVLVKNNKSDEARKILNNVLNSEKSIKNLNGEILTYNAIGKTYEAEANEEKALEFFTKAKELSGKSKLPDLEVQTNDNLANVYRKQKKVDKELETRNSTIQLNNTNNNSVANTKQNLEIGNAYLNTNQFDQAANYYDISTQSQQNIINQEPEVQKQINPTKIFGLSKGLEENADAYKSLADELVKQKNYEKALALYERYSRLQDSIKTVRTREMDEALALSANIGKNQQRIDLLEKERELSEKSVDILKQDKVLKEEQIGFKNLIIISLLVLVLFMMGTVFFIMKSSREKKRVHQLLALKSLRGQMNPHFIFNALNSVNHYVSQNDERQANRYLSDFSRLMRLVMDSSKHDLIPLSEEMEMLRLYLQLEHSRFSEKFDYKININPFVEEAEYELPPMLIQPYLENAVWHGLRYIDGKGLLELKIDVEQNNLIITVTDNGIGRKRSAEVKTQNQKKQNSLGMQNIENRVKIMNEVFNRNIAIVVSDAFTGQVNCGTKVKITIPQKQHQHA